MPQHFTPAELLRQKAIIPANYEHVQAQASATWDIIHGLDLPGTPIVITYDGTGAWMANSGVVAINQNIARISFPGPVIGTAIVYIQDGYAVDSLLVRSELEVGGVEMTGSSGQLLIGGTAVSLSGHAHTFASISSKPTTLSGYGITDALSSSLLGATNGVATLVNGTVPSSQLPSYVDDVIEAASAAALPATGEAGKIYVALDTNKLYRWSGSTYVMLPTSGPASTDGLAEGAANLYFTAARARAAVTSVTGNAGTATKLAVARTLSVSGDATGSASFDGSANAAIALTLANSGVTAGTYPKVTVDAKGRVTAGAALTAADIPSLDWSKIATGKPTTLSGYGITDASTSADLAAHVAAANPHPQYVRSLTYKTATTISTTSTSLNNVTEGVISLAANTLYRITMYVRFSSTASGTGIRLGLTCPTGAAISAVVSIPVRSDSTSGAFQGTIVVSGDSVIGTGVEIAGTAYIAVIQGVVSTGATAGSLQLQFGSEVTGSSVSVLPFSVGFADIM